MEVFGGKPPPVLYGLQGGLNTDHLGFDNNTGLSIIIAGKEVGL
jgi:hypothetical protein